MESADSAMLAEEKEHLNEEVTVARRLIDALQDVIKSVENPLLQAEIVEINVMTTVDVPNSSLLSMSDDTNELVFVVGRGDLHSRVCIGRVFRRAKVFQPR